MRYNDILRVNQPRGRVLLMSTSKSNGSSISEKLINIDWDFQHKENKHNIHSIHPYPAKFIPEIPKTLIKELQVPPGTAILDPFCGSGTTLVEAQLAGVPAYGVDLNPIACLISKVKTSNLPSSFLERANNCVLAAKSLTNDNDILIPNVDHWFKKEVKYALSSLAIKINEVDDVPTKEALQMALSSIIVRVSNQDSDTRYAAVDKNVTSEDVFNNFLTACSKLSKINEEYTDKRLSTVNVIESDILKVKPEQIDTPIGLVVTSPPYPNAYEYWLYHKYRMWWLGFNPLEVKKQEIGARAHFFKKNHHTAEDFKKQMDQTLLLLESVVVNCGYVCIVIGRSIIHGEFVDNAAIISDIAKNYNFKKIAEIERTIKSNRKSFNLSHANIKTETLLVFQKK